MDNNKKRNMNFLVIFILLIILNISMISASKPKDDINISVDFHSSSVIRTGNIFPASITIRNLNENATLDIKKVTILNDGKKMIKTENINKEIKSIKEDIRREKEIINYLKKPEFCESQELAKEQPEYQEYMEIISKIKNETFQKSFRLDIRDFDENPDIGEIINVSIDIEVKIGNEKYVVHKERGILFSEPLPKPPHNSPGWYVGDQHVHSNYGRHADEDDIDMLEDMVDAAKTSELDWLIFTDHSFTFSEATEWGQVMMLVLEIVLHPLSVYMDKKCLLVILGGVIHYGMDII